MGTSGGPSTGGPKELVITTASIPYPGNESVPASGLLPTGPVCVLENGPQPDDWIKIEGNIFFQLGGSFAYVTLHTVIAGVVASTIISSGSGFFISAGVSNAAQVFTIVRWYQLVEDDIDDDGHVTFRYGGVTDGAIWWDGAMLSVANFGLVVS